MTNNATKRTGRKRGNNEGSIRLRGDGRWEARVSLPNGKRKSIMGRTRKEVAEKLAAALRDVQQGNPLPSGKVTLGQFLDHWLVDVVLPTTRPRTYRSYEEAVRLHIKPTLGKVPLDRLTPQVIQSALTDMTKRGISPRRTGYMRSVLRNALNRAVRWGMLPRNLAALTDPPRWTRRQVAAMTEEQARALLAAFDLDRYGMIYTVALALGLRRGEVLGLRWSDVNLDAGTITVGGQYQHADGVWRYMEPKTDRSQRTLALPALLSTRLRQERARSLEHRLAVGPHWQDFNLVFPSEHGTPHHGENVSHRFARFLKQAGLPAMRLHDLRHGTATLLLSQGVDLRTIADVLGHTQISVTADLYAHVAPKLKQQAATAMDAVMAGG